MRYSSDWQSSRKQHEEEQQRNVLTVCVIIIGYVHTVVSIIFSYFTTNDILASIKVSVAMNGHVLLCALVNVVQVARRYRIYSEAVDYIYRTRAEYEARYGKQPRRISCTRRDACTLTNL